MADEGKLFNSLGSIERVSSNQMPNGGFLSEESEVQLLKSKFPTAMRKNYS